MSGRRLRAQSSSRRAVERNTAAIVLSRRQIAVLGAVLLAVACQTAVWGWHASLVASGIRRVEREFGQKSVAARVAGRDLRKLYEVALADGGILVDALEMRRVPAADEIEFGGPARRLPVHKLYGVNKGGPILRCGPGSCASADRRDARKFCRRSRR